MALYWVKCTPVFLGCWIYRVSIEWAEVGWGRLDISSFSSFKMSHPLSNATRLFSLQQNYKEGVSKMASTQVSLGPVGDEKVSLSQEGW